MPFGRGRIDAAAAVAAAGSGGGGPAPDTTDPVITISSPTGGTVSGNVNVSFNASDNNGVARVELLVNGTNVGTDNSAPFLIAWNSSNHVNGSVQLLAYAYDAANNRGTSQTVTVTIDNPVEQVDTTAPTVAILSPANGSTVSRTVTINIAAQDNVAIALVKCYVDGALKGTTTASTLSCSWNTRKATTGHTPCAPMQKIPQASRPVRKYRCRSEVLPRVAAEVAGAAKAKAARSKTRQALIISMAQRVRFAHRE